MPTPTQELFAAPAVAVEPRDGGVLLLRSTEPLGASAPSMAHLFRENAARHPDRVLAAERSGDAWRDISWGAAREQADAIAQALLDWGLGPDRPVMVLSGNSLDHLVLMLGAFTA